MYKVDRTPPPVKQPLLPMSQTPGLMHVLFQSITGLIILINTVIFVFTSIYSESIFTPSTEALEFFGARDTVAVANGQYWRLFTANFLHIGILHYLFNNYALYIVGWNLERLWGKWRFLLLYLISGFAGNVLSQIMSINISAGASASIFGLFGSGLFVEWKLKRRLAEKGISTKNFNSVFTGLVIINIGIGFMIPQIDNAAHIGGLISGVIVAFAYSLSLDNIDSRYKQPLSVLIILLVSAAIAVGAWYSARSDMVEARLLVKLHEAKMPHDKYYVYSRLVKLSPDNYRYQLDRLSLSLAYGDYNTASSDLAFCLGSETRRKQCLSLVKKFSDSGLNKQAIWLEQKLSK